MAEIVLRQYQEAAIDSIMAAMPTDRAILVQAATGAGKTLIFCELIRRLLAQWPYIRIGILAHRRELITQAQDKLLKVWPDAPIGIACASVSSSIDTEKPVMIGSVQTLVRRVTTTSPFDLVIIDEAHRLPAMNIKSQYSDWLRIMTDYNPNIRILGVTATPFRFFHGYIFGKVCKPGNVNLFTDLHYRIGISELQRQGYLCGYRAKVLSDISDDLAGVRRTGDYNVSDLSAIMSKQHHVGSAVNAMNQYAAARKHIIVFAVTIAHAQKLCDAFGDQSTIIHSELSDKSRIQALDDFENGRVRIIVNVGILTEGFDSPATDCIIMCRPTVSPGLFCQMVGRGLRPHPDKTDVLILDLANNCVTHGDPDKPKVEIPKPSKNKKEEILEKKQRVCPQCQEAVDPGCTLCPACGWEFVIENNQQVSMTDYQFNEKPKPVVLEIATIEIGKHVAKSGNLMAKLSIEGYQKDATYPTFVNHFMMFGDGNHPYAIGKSRGVWKQVVGDNQYPESTQEFIDRRIEFEGCLAKGSGLIEVIEDGKWLKITRWGVEPEARLNT